MREQTQFTHILKIVSEFQYKIPLHHFIKNYFRNNKQLGSRDRRLIAAFVYNYYRLGKTFEEIAVEQKIFFSNFILSNWNEMMDFLNEQFADNKFSSTKKTTYEKIEAVKNITQFSLEKIFPFKYYLCDGVDYQKFLISFLQQPLVWIRIRKGFREKVIEELNIHEIEFITSPLTLSKREGFSALGFKNATKLSQLVSFEKGYFEIQDLSSQKTTLFFPGIKNEHWWDCCAGAGGKSLMLADAFPEIKLSLSDSRESILQNAKERLKKAGIKNSKLQGLDLLSANCQLPSENLFSGIIVDVPCTGSGTWARTPENLWNFTVDKIEKFSAMQKNILQNIVKHIQPQGYLVYITCSVFKKENEDNIQFLQKNFGLQLIKQEIIKGYDEGADTMFAALLKRES